MAGEAEAGSQSRGDRQVWLSEWSLLLVLASIHFTSVMDFMIIMPLGPQLLRELQITPAEFGLLVSSYTLSASVAGFLAVFLVDRFDRKTALLTLYAGFAVGTLLCGFAPTYLLLLTARSVTGIFGGILSALALAIIGDVFPPQRRGTATGIVMSAFAVASIVGVPFGLFLGNAYGWQAPFLLLGGLGLFVWVGAFLALPELRGHLEGARSVGPLQQLWHIASEPNHLRAFAFVVALMVGGFSVIPFIGTALVANNGVTEQQLPLVYILGGVAALFASPISGRLADRFGHRIIYMISAVLMILPVVLLTNLGQVALWMSLAVTTMFFIFNTGRVVSAMAMVTGSVLPERRGGFMSASASLQHLSAGLAAFVAGLLIGQDDQQRLTGYASVGLLAVAAILVSLYLVTRLRAAEEIDRNEETEREPVAVGLEPAPVEI